jgi:dihydroorotate dehydrogenase/Pyruvate/2-oxoacid:ferredoxin oxidoreductase delta subunit
VSKLKTSFCGLDAKNPFILGAGPITGTAEGIKRAVDAGYGMVITKTSSQFEYYHKFPYPRYNLLNYDKAGRGRLFRDWIWFHNDHNSPVGPAEFAHIIEESADYCKSNKCLLVGSFAASSLEEWRKCAKAYEDAGADVLQLNFCCSGPGSLQDIAGASGDKTMLYGDVLGRDMDKATQVIEAVKSVVSIPVGCKMPPAERLKIKDNAARLQKSGANAVELYANAKGTRIDIENAAPIGTGTTSINSHGYLGDVVYDVSQLARENIPIDIIAGRGVRFWSDGMELLMAGAQVVELCTIAFVYGVGIVQDFIDEFESFMERKNYASIDELRGKALKKQLKPSQIKDSVKTLVAEIAPPKCGACGRCQEVCAYCAAKVVYGKGESAGRGMARIDKNRCVGCTLCAQVCPYDAIVLKERTVEEYLAALYSQHPEAIESEMKV